jgi:homocysteine S-methyltransferase
MSNVEILKQKLARKEKILINGPTGTEIQRRGVSTKLPLWSAAPLLTHPDIVRTIHEDYISAGAEIIVTNTFRTNVRTLERIGLGELSTSLTHLAVKLAKEARENSGKKDVIIAGDIAPLEDCYTPSLVPSERELLEEHRRNADDLAKAGVDIIQIETVGTIREGLAMAKAAHETGLDFIFSFICNADGNLLSGESIEDAVQAISAFNPLAFATNCRPPATINASVYKLLKASEKPVGVYANGVGCPADDLGWEFCKTGVSAHEYLKYAKKWVNDGVTLIGGCCGTTPEYIKLIKEFIDTTKISL